MQATAIIKTNEGDLLPGANIQEEGRALVFVKQDGRMYLQQSQGVTGEEFAGFALMRPFPPQVQPRVQEFVLGRDDKNGEIVLARLPVAGQLLIKVGGAKATQVVDDEAPAAAGHVAVNAAALLFSAADIAAKKTVYVQYLYELSASEAQRVVGDAPLGGNASNIRGRAPYIELGDVAVDVFDASVDWSDDSVMHPSTGAEGLLSIGKGTELKNVLIKQAPSVESPYLVLTVK
jgi:hypothetical protein